jgi:hypothetical protein
LRPLEVAALKRAVDMQRPEFGPRLTSGGIVTEAIKQPWFARHRVIEVMSQTVFPAMTIHVVFGPDGGCGVLTGNPAVFEAMVAADPPPRLADAQSATIYANVADYWTTESPLGELGISSLDEIPWLAEIDDIELMMVEALQDAVGAEVSAPSIRSTDDGFVQVRWVVSAAQLLRREVHVSRGGQVRRTDELVEGDLPVHPGRMWGMVDGRLVPTG